MMPRMLQRLYHDWRAPTARRGFTLLELAVVLGVIALISGTGAVIAGNALKTADRISTQEKLNIIKLALDSHAKTYGYLPCPAARNLTPTGGNFGLEGRTNGTTNYTAGSACAFNGGTPSLTGVSQTGSILLGAVPVRSLGLPDSYAGDAWGNKFTYGMTYTAGFAGDPTRWATKTGQISIKYGFISNPTTTKRTTLTYAVAGINSGTGGVDRVTVSSSTGMSTGSPVTLSGGTNLKGSFLVSATGAGWVELSNTSYVAAHNTDSGNVDFLDTSGGGAVAYIVISHGPNGSGAYAMNSASNSAKPCNATLADYENCDGANVNFYETDYNDDADSTNAGKYFDDFLVWGSNEGARIPVSTTVYTSNGATRMCPTNVCEPWCASCERNYPATVSGSNLSATPPSLTTTFGLCRKVITSNSSDCKAACFWTGIDGSNLLYRCP